MLPLFLPVPLLATHTGKVPSKEEESRRVRRIASRLKKDVFSSSGTASIAVDAVATLLSSPEMRELMRAEYWFDKIVDLQEPLAQNDRAAIPQIIDNVRAFLDTASLTKGGTYDISTDNAIRAVAAALVESELNMKGKMKAYSRLLGLSHKRVLSAIQQRAELLNSQDSATSTPGRWKQVSRKAYRNRYGDPIKNIIDQFLHKVSRPDNSSRRGPIKIPHGIDEDGNVTFELHSPVTIDDDLNSLLIKLTGRDYSQPMQTDPTTGLKQHPLVEGAAPDELWREIVAENRDRVASNIKPINLSTRLLRECMCDCMGKSATYKCVDKKRFAFESMLALYLKGRAQWHANDHRDGDGCDCGCDEEMLKRWASSPAESLEQSMCAAEDVPELAVPEYDHLTAELTGKATVPKFHSLACHNGKCGECGWAKIHTGPKTVVPLGDGETAEIQACRVESSDAPFAWYSWQRLTNTVPSSKGDDDPDHTVSGKSKATYSTYWFPVTGTRAQFMVALRNAYVEYRVHMFWVQWHSHAQKRAQYKLLIEPAISGRGKVAAWQRDFIMSHSDFAATITIPRSAEATGAFAQTSQMFTSVLTYNPKLQRVDDLPPGHFRDKLMKKGVVAYPSASTTVLFAMSNADNNAEFYASVLTQAMEVLHTGRVPSGSKMEFVHNRIRLPGSDTSKPLGHDLVDFDKGKHPVPKFVETGHTGQSVVSLQGDGITFKMPDGGSLPGRSKCTKLLEYRDGCKAQFQGRDSFLFYSLFERLTGVVLCNVCCEAEDGKGPADGLSRVVSQGARSLALHGVNPGSKARGLFEMVASHRSRPKVPRELKREFTAASDFLYCYAGPQDASAFADFTAATGYTGSSKDHVYFMEPRTRPTRVAASTDIDRGFVTTVNRPCGCDMCLQMRPADCLVSCLFKNATCVREMERKKGFAVRSATRSRVAQEWAKAICPGTVLVVRVHTDDANTLNEPYYLALALGKEGESLAWRNGKTQMIDGNVFKKNDWLVRMRWLHYCPTAQPPLGNPDLAGARGYRFQPGESAIVFSAFGIVTKETIHTSAQELIKPELGEFRWMPSSAHEAVVEDGIELLS